MSTYHIFCRPWAGLSALASSLSSFRASPALIFPSFFSQPPDCHSCILSRPLWFAPSPTVYLYPPPPPQAEVLEGTWPTRCLAVDSSRGCKRGPVWLNGEDFQSRADVSYTGVHHTGSMCRHELFTLFFFGRECKCRDVRGGLNKI